MGNSTQRKLIFLISDSFTTCCLFVTVFTTTNQKFSDPEVRKVKLSIIWISMKDSFQLSSPNYSKALKKDTKPTAL